MHLARQLEGRLGLPAPATIKQTKNSRPTFTREQGGYFLWLTYSKIAITRIANVNNTINSSYVLIIFPPSARLGTGSADLPAAQLRA